MKKRIFSLLLAVLLVLSMAPAALAANAGLSNFVKVNSYQGQFTDVPASEWFAENVRSAYEMGLVKGSSDTRYNPNGNITIAETLALASRLHKIYYTGDGTFTQGSPWYQVYVNYARTNGIISSGNYDYGANATRALFAQILAAALPEEALPAINTIPDGSIPDVPTSASYGAEVYRLYRAGILSGNNKYGTFTPSSPIVRKEVAAIVTRMAQPSLRKSVVLTPGPAVPTAISLNYSTVSLTVGEAITLRASITPSDASGAAVTWTSSNPSVAAVSAAGTVTAKSRGSATITVKTANGLSASCSIVVAAPSSIFSYLVDYVRTSGVYNDGDYLYNFATDSSGSYHSAYSLSYSAEDDELVLSCISVKAADPSVTFFSALFIDSAMTSPYLAGEVYTSSDQVIGSAYIQPATFRTGSSVSFFAYDGPASLQHDFEEICSNDIASSLLNLSRYVLTPLGYSLADLGFLAF